MNKIMIDISKSSFNYTLLKKLRLQRKMSTGQLAIKLGIKKRQINRYESGTVKRINIDLFKKICLIFQIDPKYILGLEWVDQTIEEFHSQDS